MYMEEQSVKNIQYIFQKEKKQNEELNLWEFKDYYDIY